MRLNAFLSCHRIVLTLALLFLTVPTWSGDSPKDHATLKGITEVHVVGERINPGGRAGSDGVLHMTHARGPGPHSILHFLSVGQNSMRRALT